MNKGILQIYLRNFVNSMKIKVKHFLLLCLQVANVASLPGIVEASVGLPDIHSGYGFAKLEIWRHLMWKRRNLSFHLVVSVSTLIAASGCFELI